MRALLLALLMSCLGASPAAADRFSLTYEGYALGVIGIGEVTLDADIGAETYQVDATLRSSGLMNWFERTNIIASAGGRMHNGAVRWERYDLDHHYAKKRRVVVMRAAEDGAISAEITPNYRLWGEPPASEEQRRRSRDPLSSLMAMAVDVGQTRRCAGAYPTFDGRFHYLLELSGGDVEHMNSGGYDGNVLQCTLGYIALAGYEASDRGRRRIPRGEVWFALPPDSTFAPPVRITTPLSAGGAVIRLAQWRRPVVNVATDAAPAVSP